MPPLKQTRSAKKPLSEKNSKEGDFITDLPKHQSPRKRKNNDNTDCKKTPIKNVKTAQKKRKSSIDFEQIMNFQCHGDLTENTSVYATKFCPINSIIDAMNPYINVSCGGNTVTFIDCEQKTIVMKYVHPVARNFVCLDWAVRKCDNVTCSVIAFGDSYGDVHLIDYLRREYVCCLDKHTKGITDVKFTNMGLNLLTSSYDDTIRLWALPADLTSSNISCVATFGDPYQNIICLSVHPQDKEFIIGCDQFKEGYDAGVCIYPLKSNYPKNNNKITTNRTIVNTDLHHSHVEALDYLNENTIISKSSSDGQIVIWDSRQEVPQPICSLSRQNVDSNEYGFRFEVYHLDAENFHLFDCNPDGDVCIYDIKIPIAKDKDIKPVLSLKGEDVKKAMHVSVSCDEKFMMVAHSNNRLALWKIKN
ncbi:hypothetical protein O9G_001797 [Rozella allomycis CSF55]|uniref:Leucine-rich repeat and WD repeat-containing protein 1 WD domain-containing protein n=1 Tax=Rozella allomycis (strain CSF55) TaxID=988480 RepID=A0A075B136_ROZAC|nr:hypothetical protein O9G_001797 [Rozella allomycis CSF55]|eukprot:EPZ34541.1 hypothetical protein O9G_001797 [Rozella allomycis CSF55]